MAKRNKRKTSNNKVASRNSLEEKIIKAAEENVSETVMQEDLSQVLLEELDDSLGAEDEAREIRRSNKKLKEKMSVKQISIIALIIIILILLLKSCGGENGILPPIFEDAEYVEQQKEHPDHIDGYTAIPVVDDFTVSKSKPYVTLYNPETNSGYSYLKYKFTNTETGEVIYESGLVEPGKKFSVPFGEFLEAGQYNVKVEIFNFDYKDYTKQKNGGQSEITITVYSN